MIENIDNWISGMALVVAVMAAIFAWYAASQAKRQADAVLGNVPASFAAFQLENDNYSSIAFLVIEIINHNRRALLIDEITIEKDDRIHVVEEAARRKSHTMAVIEAINGTPNTFEIPLRIRGCGMNEPPAILERTYSCMWKSEEDKAPARVGFRVKYRFEGSRETLIGFSSSSVVRSD